MGTYLYHFVLNYKVSPSTEEASVNCEHRMLGNRYQFPHLETDKYIEFYFRNQWNLSLFCCNKCLVVVCE